MSPPINKKRATLTVIGVVIADLILFSTNAQFASHYANSSVKPRTLAFGLLLIVLGLLAQLWATRDPNRKALGHFAYGLTLVCSVPYGLILLIAVRKIL
jgi:membrane protease YdiL (CAAX protease family)